MTANTANTTTAIPALSDVAREHLQAHLETLGDNEPHNVHRMMLDEVERPVLEMMMDYTHDNQSKAAQCLGMNRATLRAKLKRHNLI